VEKLKASCKVLDAHLKDKSFLVGDRLTLADVMCACLLSPCFQTVLDDDFRKAMPNLTKWWSACVTNPAFISRMGVVKPIQKAMIAFDPNPPKDAPKGEEKKEEKKDEVAVEDVELDLFGDDDEDADAAKKAAEAAKASKKKKEKPPEMSLIVLEVKPLDDTTNLDDLAKRIFAIEKDGLIWKSGDYKKVPVAFGIFKLVLGFSCEDAKVSVDQV